MRSRIRRISPGSVFRISFFLYAAVCLVVLFLYAVFFGALAVLGGSLFDPGEIPGWLGGLGMAALAVGGLGFSIVYAAFLAAVSALAAVLYNLFAAWVGGLEVELAAVEETGAARTALPPAPPAPPDGPAVRPPPPPSSESPPAHPAPSAGDSRFAPGPPFDRAPQPPAPPPAVPPASDPPSRYAPPPAPPAGRPSHPPPAPDSAPGGDRRPPDLGPG